MPPAALTPIQQVQSSSRWRLWAAVLVAVLVVAALVAVLAGVAISTDEDAAVGPLRSLVLSLAEHTA